MKPLDELPCHDIAHCAAIRADARAVKDLLLSHRNCDSVGLFDCERTLLSRITNMVLIVVVEG